MPRRMILIIAAAVITAQSLPGSARQGTQLDPNLRQATAEVHLLVKQSLESVLAENKLPDGNLLGSSTRIAIREELRRAKLRLGREALPQREGYEFYLISEAQTQTEADRTSRAVHYITVDQPSITGETATLSVGVDVTFPRVPRVTKLCCCTGHGQFQRIDGRWTFLKWSGMTCS
jgi:hypothetical protein